jgi:serine/threonine protein kinase
MCKAVDTLHERNIIHRDIKLENIFITDDNSFKLGKYFVFYFFFFFFFLLIFFLLLFKAIMGYLEGREFR